MRTFFTLLILVLLGAVAFGFWRTAHNPTNISSQNLDIGIKGLSVTDVRLGDGPAAQKGDKLTVHYLGKLTDGSEFDSSYERGKPFSFTLGAGEVIAGWETGLVGMKVGGKRKLVIAPELAYGETGTPDSSIPPNATLVFEIELLEINK